MKLSSLVLPLAALALAAPPVHAEQAAPQVEAQQEARIPFVNHGGIRDWHAHDRDTLYIQGRNRAWYEATLMRPAYDLRFSTAIGFDTGPSDTLDKFSTVVIRGQRYAIKSLVKIEGEPPHKRDKRDKRDQA
jgi:hypothetical protein